jgi:phosphoserine phosphatase
MKAQPAVLALFDLDHTLLTVDCDEAWVEFLIEQGVVDRATFEAGNRVVGEKYRRGEVGLLEFTEFYLSTLANHPVDQLESWREAYLRAKILPAIPSFAQAGRTTSTGTSLRDVRGDRFLAAPIERKSDSSM